MTEKFSADWLTQRRPFDGAARSRELAEAFLRHLDPDSLIVDLGAGTGSNARYLQPLAKKRIRWRLVDRDIDLLRQAADIPDSTTTALDFAQDIAKLPLGDVDAICASALFDLVSREWFEDLVAHARPRPLLMSLTATGHHAWTPADDLDEPVAALFAKDMQRDKGFGPAMGFNAVRQMTECLKPAGYRFQVAESDWRIENTETEMLTAMVTMIADVAARHGGDGMVNAWRQRKLERIAADRLSLVVGHQDILALNNRR